MRRICIVAIVLAALGLATASLSAQSDEEQTVRRIVSGLMKAAQRGSNINNHFAPTKLAQGFTAWAQTHPAIDSIICKTQGDVLVAVVTEKGNRGLRSNQLSFGYVDAQGNTAGGRRYDTKTGRLKVVGFFIGDWQPLTHGVAPVVTSTSGNDILAFIRSALRKAREGSVEDLETLYEGRFSEGAVEWFHGWAQSYPERAALLTTISHGRPMLDGSLNYLIVVLTPSQDGNRRHGDIVTLGVRKHADGTMRLYVSLRREGQPPSRIAARQLIMSWNDASTRTIEGPWERTAASQ